LAVRQDSGGLLWVALKVAKPDWSKAIEAGDEHCCESLIEVLNPLTGALLGSTRIPLHLQVLMADGYIGAVAEGEGGEPLLVLYRAQLAGPRPQ
jgi:hypothetical protein